MVEVENNKFPSQEWLAKSLEECIKILLTSGGVDWPKSKLEDHFASEVSFCKRGVTTMKMNASSAYIHNIYIFYYQFHSS